MKPEPAKPAAPKKTSLKGRGRFVGLLAVGKEKYQAIAIEIVDGEIVSSERLSRPSTSTTNGVTIEGDALASAAMQVAIGMQRYVRDRASELWQKQGLK